MRVCTVADCATVHTGTAERPVAACSTTEAGPWKWAGAPGDRRLTDVTPDPQRPRDGGGSRLLEVAGYFLRLGFISFGGPAAHIALMRRDLVQRRKWLSDAEFVDLLGITNLIPGPNSTEMSMQIGYGRAGWRGLWIGGLSFIGPAVMIVLVLAWGYVRWGSTPVGEAFIWGIQPLILAIIVEAIWGLRTAAIKGWVTGLTAIASVGLAIAGVNELAILLGAGLLPLVASVSRKLSVSSLSGLVPTVSLAAGQGERGLAELFFVFLKIGGLLYGSGYVLFAFLEDEFVSRRAWITHQQLVDAIAVGQFTPGPLFSSATFVGFLVRGWPGAGVATAGIFIPSFLLVGLTRPLLPKLRGSRRLAPFLDGVNAAAIGLMAAVTLSLGSEVLDEPAAIGLFALGAVVLLRFQPNSVWLVLGGAAAGLTRALVT